MEAQQILSNIFDKIDAPSIQDDDEVFEGFEQSSEQDNDLTNTLTTTSPPRVVAAPTATPTAHTKNIESNLLKSNNENGEYTESKQTKRRISYISSSFSSHTVLPLSSGLQQRQTMKRNRMCESGGLLSVNCYV